MLLASKQEVHPMPIVTINPVTVAESYLAVWNEANDVQRRSLLEQGWAVDAHYVDPLMQGEGREDIACMIEAARLQFSGHSFTLAGQPDGHGAYVRFSWILAPAGGGTPVAGGTDVVRLDAEGRIAEVVGFLDGALA